MGRVQRCWRDLQVSLEMGVWPHPAGLALLRAPLPTAGLSQVLVSPPPGHQVPPNGAPCTAPHTHICSPWCPDQRWQLGEDVDRQMDRQTDRQLQDTKLYCKVHLLSRHGLSAPQTLPAAALGVPAALWALHWERCLVPSSSRCGAGGSAPQGVGQGAGGRGMLGDRRGVQAARCPGQLQVSPGAASPAQVPHPHGRAHQDQHHRQLQAE